MYIIPANPKIEAIRENVRNSDTELLQLIDGPLTSIDASKLYQSPAENEWTIMQNLAHIVEFMPYWAGEIEKLVAEPGRNFGRTPQDVGRLKGISEHEMDSLKDSDLELTGKHVRYGEKPLDWFLEDVVTNHLSGHVEQIKRCLELVG